MFYLNFFFFYCSMSLALSNSLSKDLNSGIIVLQVIRLIHLGLGELLAFTLPLCGLN